MWKIPYWRADSAPIYMEEKPVPNFITQEEIHRSNDAWDRENGHRDIQARYGRGWKLDDNIIGEKMDDHRIEKYERRRARKK